MEVLRVVLQLRQAIPVRIHGHKNRLHNTTSHPALKLVRDGANLYQLGRANVRAVAEPEVQQDERPVEVSVGHWSAVHIDQRERPTQGRLARGGDLGGHSILLLVPFHSVVTHHQCTHDTEKSHRSPSERPPTATAAPSATAGGTAISVARVSFPVTGMTCATVVLAAGAIRRRIGVWLSVRAGAFRSIRIRSTAGLIFDVCCGRDGCWHCLRCGLGTPACLRYGCGVKDMSGG